MQALAEAAREKWTRICRRRRNTIHGLYRDPKTFGIRRPRCVTNRVTKVVKGGRRCLRFAALVVVGDKTDTLVSGTGKAQEVPEAIRKSNRRREEKLSWKCLWLVLLSPHEVIGGVFVAAVSLMKPG